MKRIQDMVIRPVAAGTQMLSGAGSRGQTPSAVLTFIRTATKRAAGSKTSMKDSAGRRLGAKKGDGELVRVGEIIYRQRGTKIYPGENMGIGRDHTLFAEEPGYVRYYYDPFHPKRKFAGIAMSKHARLPTPHFAPRPRRFGYEIIEDPEKAERERQVMKRKEYLARPEIEKQLEDRAAAREQRRIQFAQKLDDYISGLTEEEKLIASKRLVVIQNYLAGGRSIEEARTFADADYEQDCKLRNEFQGDENALKELKVYKAVAEKSDTAVSFDPERQLCKAYSAEELDRMAQETLAKIEELTKADAMTNEIREKVRLTLKKPCFSLSNRLALYRKYTYKPVKLPQLTLEQKEKLVKEGKGRIIPTWNDEKRKVEKVYVPYKNKPQPTA
jgi:large subunit ribosomal protein L27